MEDRILDLIPVEGHNSLGRDADSNAIVNTDDSAYDAYVKARENARNKDRTLDDLKREVDELKELIKDLVQKKDK